MISLALVVDEVDVSLTIPRAVVARDWGLGKSPSVGVVRAHAAQLALRLLREHDAHAGESWSIIVDADGHATVTHRT